MVKFAQASYDLFLPGGARSQKLSYSSIALKIEGILFTLNLCKRYIFI
jgi:hypothetical protein